MKLNLGIYTAVVLLFLSIGNAERSDTRILLTSNATLREKHGEDYCAMYDICGARSDGKVVNCPFGSPSVKPDDLLSAKIQSLCPTISGNICCTEAQFDTLRTQVQQAIPFLVGCPACLRNFLNLFCELSCSPHQSQFINVTSISKVKNNSTVGSIDYYITDTYGEGLFESCKEVKFGTMNSRVIEFVGAGAKNFREWFAFIGRKALPNLPGSPYAINFRSDADESIGMKPMNVTAYSCGDTSLGCSCGDCPSSPVCSSSAPPPLHEKGSCSVRIGSLKARCIEVSVAIVYILLASLFLGWGLFHKRGSRNPAMRTKSLMNVTNGGLAQQVHGKKDENQPRSSCSETGTEPARCEMKKNFQGSGAILAPRMLGARMAPKAQTDFSSPNFFVSHGIFLILDSRDLHVGIPHVLRCFQSITSIPCKRFLPQMSKANQNTINAH